MLSFQIRLTNLLNAAISTTGASSAALDLRNTAGNIFLGVFSRTGGTNSMAVTVEHSEDNSTWGAVPASALFDTLTGDADTFSTVTTAAVNEWLGLNRQQCKRYVRVTLAGASLSHEVSVVAATQPQMSEYS